MLNITAGVRNTRRVRTHLAATSVSVTKDTLHTDPNVSVSFLTSDDIISVLLNHYISCIFLFDFLFFVLIFTDFVFVSNSLVRATSKHFVNGITGMYLLCNRQQRSCGRLCCYFSQDWPENAALFESHIACVQCMWSFLTNVARSVVCVLATPVQ